MGAGSCSIRRQSPESFEDIVKDSHLYSGFRLFKRRPYLCFPFGEGNRPADLYAADVEFKNVRRLTDSNPQLKTKRLGKTELVPYLDVDATRCSGCCTIDRYEAGKKYPTVYQIYEQFFDDTFNSTINILTSNGYAVMQPSVSWKSGSPVKHG